MDGRLRQGVTAENNAFVLLLKAVGPGDVPEAVRGKYFKSLGIQPLPDKGEFLCGYYDFLQREKAAGRLGDRDARQEEISRSEWIALVSRPWAREQFPLVAKWLAANGRPLAIITEATKRPRFYEPLVGADATPLLDAVTPGMRRHGVVHDYFGDIAQALAFRAMLRLHEGDRDGAWQDLLTCRRLAHLIFQGPTLIFTNVGDGMNRRARYGQQALLQSPGISAGQMSRMLKDLAALPHMPSVADKLDRDERLLFLDAVTWLARGNDKPFHALLRSQKLPTLDLVFKMYGSIINWNVPLQMSNSWYDQFCDAARKPSRRERLAAMQLLSDEYKAARRESRSALVLGDDPSRAVSKRVGLILSHILQPATNWYSQGMACCNAEDLSATEEQNVRTRVCCHSLSH